MKWDGHTHTHFCKHGSGQHLNLYLERAAALGFERYTVSEHPPLPNGWVDDPQLFAELAMSRAELRGYLACVKEAKQAFDGRLEVLIGLEMDYLYENESFTEALLSETNGELEDALISVHYLPGRGGMRCVDFKPEDFIENLLSYYGSMEKVVDEYYNHIELAIRSASRWKLRTRLGHINLIEKFRAALPPIDPDQIRERLTAILPLLQESGVGIDVNTAGMRKSTCGQAYVPPWFMKQCAARGIPLVFGSDAHDPGDVGADWAWFQAQMDKLTD